MAKMDLFTFVLLTLSSIYLSPVLSEELRDEYDTIVVYDHITNLLILRFSNDSKSAEERADCVLRHLKANKTIEIFFKSRMTTEPELIDSKLAPYLPEAENVCPVLIEVRIDPPNNSERSTSEKPSIQINDPVVAGPIVAVVATLFVVILVFIGCKSRGFKTNKPLTAVNEFTHSH